MVFWSMIDLTKAALANTPKPIASWVKMIGLIFDLLDHEPEREREREKKKKKKKKKKRQR